MSTKKTKGKQKIEIKMIENKNERLVTFSKRKSGIYKKITELSTLCGADIAFLAFSAAGNSFSFGSPSFEAVADRFMNEDRPNQDNNNTLLLLQGTIMDAHRKVRLNELSKKYCSLVDELDAETERTKALPTKKTNRVSKEWWRMEPSEIPNDEVLIQILTQFEDMHENLCNVADQRLRRGVT